MPHFAIGAADLLERNGISLEQALADLSEARDMPGLPSGRRVLVGRLAMYECHQRPIFGQVDLLVIRVFVRHGR